MRSQAERDEQTVTIATAIGIFVCVLAVGVTVVAVANSTSDQWGEAALKGAALLGLLLAATYLIRHRRG